MNLPAVRRGLALVAMAMLGGVAVYLWLRPPPPGTLAYTAPAYAGQPLAAADAPAPLVAPVSNVTPADREARRFNRYDKDRDGQITTDEYFVTRRKAFAKLDLNGDGKLSFDEYSAKAAKKFATADTGHDGKLDAAEFATTAVKHRPRAINCPPPEKEAPQPDEG